MEITKTERGFELIRFKDRSGADCSLQQSSVADYQQPGSSAVWLGIGDNRMHLNVDHVSELVAHLQNWLDDGSFRVGVTDDLDDLSTGLGNSTDNGV